MIILEKVSKRYGAVEALKEVSLEIPREGVTGLLGRNGAGKTTMLNLITGFLSPTAGSIRIGGKDLDREGRACRRMIGFLPEKPPLYDEMTTEDYLSFVCELREVRAGSIPPHVTEILALCGLSEVRGRVLGHLSRGYRQRAGIAQALCGNPEVVILDEPTAGLDPKQTVEIRELIRRLGQERTVLFSSHILGEVQQICDRAVILKEGRVIRVMELKAPEGDTIRLRLRTGGDRERVAAALGELKVVLRVEPSPGRPDGREERSAAMPELLVTCRRQDEHGAAEDQIFRVCAGIGAPIRRMSEETETLETVFLRETETDF